MAAAAAQVLAVAQNDGLREALITIGFQVNLATRVVNENFMNGMDDLRHLDDEGVVDIAKAIRDNRNTGGGRGRGAGQAVMGAMHIRRMQALVYWAQKRYHEGRAPDHNLVNMALINTMMEEKKVRKQDRDP